jgi:hypothetical protein
MNTENLLRDCLEQIGARNEIAGLTLDAEGSACIEVKDGRRVHVTLDRETGRVFIYRMLLPLRTVDPTLLKRCMTLNFLEIGTGGGVLSLWARMEAIVYHTSIAADRIEAIGLQHAIEVVLVDGERLAHALDVTE